MMTTTSLGQSYNVEALMEDQVLDLFFDSSCYHPPTKRESCKLGTDLGIMLQTKFLEPLEFYLGDCVAVPLAEHVKFEV